MSLYVVTEMLIGHIKRGDWKNLSPVERERLADTYRWAAREIEPPEERRKGGVLLELKNSRIGDK